MNGIMTNWDQDPKGRVFTHTPYRGGTEGDCIGHQLKQVPKAGSKMDISNEMMLITTRSSINVNPNCFVCLFIFRAFNLIIST